MSDVVDGIGGAIEGALAGRAVEPKRGEAADHSREPQECANCGTESAGNYCPNCGQKTHIHRTLSALGHDLLHGVLHLDGKLSHTLPLLVFKPGKLTRRYIEGERARFISPMSMFLFTVFAMFAVFQIVGLTVPTTLPEAGPAQLESAVAGQAERIEGELKKVEEQLAAEGLSADERSELEAERTELQTTQSNLAEASVLLGNGEQPEVEASDGVKVATQEEDGWNLTFTGIEEFDAGLVKKWNENPGLMLYKLQANAYKFSWLLIPLSIPFVWLTFAWKRRFKAYDHAVFVTYSLSFMSLLFIAASLLFTASSSLSWVSGALMIFVPPIHLYKQLRGTYELGRLSALWRLMVISFFIWIVIALFLQILFLLGAF